MKIACTRCERRYAWRPELAGKSVRCKCGGQVVVPAAPAGPAALSAAETPAARPVTAVRPTLPYRSSAPTREEKRFSYDNMVDPRRDIYAPIGVLATGTIALMAWAVVEAQANSFGIALFGTFILVKTLLKTLVLVGLAILIAPAAGLSFGGLWSALLKLAAIVVFADALLVWLETIMEHYGALPTGRRSNIYVGMMKTLLTGAFIAIQLRVLFDMDSEETGMIAIPMAILNRVLDFVLWLVILGAIAGMTAPAAGPAAAAAPAVAAAPAAPPPTPAQAKAAAADVAIRQKADRGILKEGTQWLDANRRRPAEKGLLDRLYAAGAPKIWIEGYAGLRFHVQMPPDEAARKRIVEVARSHATALAKTDPAAPSPETLEDVGQRYLTVEVPLARKK